MSLARAKAELREVMFARRKLAFDNRTPGSAGRLSEVLTGYPGTAISGYWPIRTEIDPRPTLAEAAARGPVGLPVVGAAGSPLTFRLWEPGTAMERGAFGAAVPVGTAEMEPELLILPLLAFDRAGGRLGYGGGFYDRTLERLRARRATLAVGFAFAAQEVDTVPMEPVDQRLDLLVTEREVIEITR